MARISIRDIASKADVSIGTVDRVLHNRGRVSKETKSRVQRIIAQLDYRPNIFARNLSLAKTYQFGVVMPLLSQDSSYWRIPADGIRKAQRDLEAYKIHVRHFYFDRYSEASFERAFRKALGNSLDGILLAPVLPRIAERLLPLIPDSVPRAFFDSDIPGAGCLCSIGQDPAQSGTLAANLMRTMVQTPGCVAIIKVTPEDFHINERMRGFQSGMKERQDVTVATYEVESHRGRSGFSAVVKNIVRDNSDLKGIFVTNAWTHPVARAVKSLSFGKKICIVGYDLVAENIRYLNDGAIDYLISQRPAMQGYEGIFSLYRHVVLRDKVEKRIMMPLDILTRDNIKYYRD